MSLLYRRVTVVLAIPSVSQEHAQRQAREIVQAQLSHLRSDDTLLPIRSYVVPVAGAEARSVPPEVQASFLASAKQVRG